VNRLTEAERLVVAAGRAVTASVQEAFDAG
jgi:hypothetical protein